MSVQSSCNCYPLSLASGKSYAPLPYDCIQLLFKLIDVVGQLCLLQSGPDLSIIGIALILTKGNILPNRSIHQLERLGYITNDLAVGIRDPENIMSVELHRAMLGLVKPQNNIDQRRLSRT